jgi:prepilin-type N-terminal cleavage/methylation domain-containing protein
MNRNLRKCKGFTLVEVLLSLAVFCIGIIAVLGTFPMLFDSINRNEEHTKVTLLAQYVMDEIWADNVFISVDPIVKTDIPECFLKDIGEEQEVYVKTWGDSPTTFQNVYVQVSLKNREEVRNT